MKEINRMNAELAAMKKAKRAAEYTALADCAEDFSDVSFSLGTPSVEIAAIKLAVVMVIIFGGRLMWRKLPAEFFGYETTAAVKIAIIVAAAVILLLLCLLISGGKRERISVKQKTLYYKGGSYEVSEISHIILKALGGIRIYSKGKVIAKASQADDNAELLIAWAKKCGINMIDRRN